jgi:Response receiver domain
MAKKAHVENDLAVEIVSDFLQSVVIVDDEADFDPVLHQAAAVAAKEKEEVIRPSRFPKPRLKTPDRSTGEGNILDAKRVVDAFAERGIVCAILRPAEGEDPSDRTLKVTRRADILVLDWNFHADNGDTARQLIRGVLGGDLQDNRRRLIAIYTAERDLGEILTSVRAVLLEAKGRTVRSGGSYALDAGDARVVVLAKPESQVQTPRARRQIVAYEDLADVLIQQFSAFMYGLVSNVALKSVAALRSNTHQLLKQLGPELDAGYLWHRAVQVYPQDAEQQLVDLVSAELRAILDDCDVRDAASSRAIRQWLEKRGESDFSKRFGETQARSIGDVMDLLEYGSAAKTAQSEKVVAKFPKMKAKAAHKKSDEIAAFADSKAKATQSNEAFAVLASHRTQYSKPQPHLTLGTIISSGTGKKRRYWLCLQPVCDAVRLSSARTFPFLELNAADGGGFQFVLQGRGRTSIRLQIDVKPQSLTMLEFHPKVGNDCVVADVRSSQFFFSRGKRRYRWEAELKREHAQRFAERLANEFSRIGLVESEWLRLWGGEKKAESKGEKGAQALSD